MTPDREPHGHGGVEVGSADMAQGVDHHGYHEPESEGNPRIRELPDGDRTAAREHERESADELGRVGPRPVSLRQVGGRDPIIPARSVDIG